LLLVYACVRSRHDANKYVYCAYVSVYVVKNGASQDTQAGVAGDGVQSVPWSSFSVL